jgi:diketogulonate reductase-like aldo/keto reductase
VTVLHVFVCPSFSYAVSDTAGVSNFCPSCFACLSTGTKDPIWPAVNQIQYHVGMGSDPEGLLSYCSARGIVVQAYSPLASGKLLSPPPAELAAVAKAQGKSAAQVALKWILQQDAAPMSLVTKADTREYITEDIELFDWSLTPAQMHTLDSATKPSNVPSWGCTAA